MQKIKKLLLVISLLFLTGCAPLSPPANRFVTGVQVQLHRSGQQLQRTYTDPQKIETVLYYLRALDAQRPAPFDPERLDGARCRIDLQYSDGTTKHIFQVADRFLSEGFHPWKWVDPKKTAFFYPLLKSMPSDQ